MRRVGFGLAEGRPLKDAKKCLMPSPKKITVKTERIFERESNAPMDKNPKKAPKMLSTTNATAKLFGADVCLPSNSVPIPQALVYREKNPLIHQAETTPDIHINAGMNNTDIFIPVSIYGSISSVSIPYSFINVNSSSLRDASCSPKVIIPDDIDLYTRSRTKQNSIPYKSEYATVHHINCRKESHLFMWQIAYIAANTVTAQATADARNTEAPDETATVTETTGTMQTVKDLKNSKRKDKTALAATKQSPAISSSLTCKDTAARDVKTHDMIIAIAREALPGRFVVVGFTPCLPPKAPFTPIRLHTLIYIYIDYYIKHRAFCQCH